MFNIDINFLKDRQAVEADSTAQPVGDVRWLIGGGAFALVLIVATGVAYFLLNGESSRLQGEVARLEAQEKKLDETLVGLKQSEKEVQEIDAQVSKLLQLFTGDVPASAILQDIRQRTPSNVRIDSLTQMGKKVSVTGQAAAINASNSAFNPVNDFVLKLQESPYLAEKGVTLKSIKLSPPNKDVKVDIAEYQIEMTLTPQTALGLQQSLQQSGSEGLLARINILKQKGLDPTQLSTPTEGAQPK